MPIESAEEAFEHPTVAEAMNRGIIRIHNGKIEYSLNHQRTYNWNDPEEWVRAFTVAWLIVSKDYPANRIRTEVSVPRRVPGDFADVVVYKDDACKEPYIVVENKAAGQTAKDRKTGIEQLFGNSNSLRAPFGLYEDSDNSAFYNIGDFPSTERTANRLGDRNVLPSQYANAPDYIHVAGQVGDIEPVTANVLGVRVRNAHYIICAGGRRDPLIAFDEWSKLLLAKVIDEKYTPTGQPRKFQWGTKETVAAVTNRVHKLFCEATRLDPTIFPSDERIKLPDQKIAEVVKVLQGISFTHTDVDTVGRAFESFFDTIFRGDLGQYFTARELSKFIVAALNISHNDYVLDPTAGPGGLLLEVLLQTWNRIDNKFKGQRPELIERLKTDFAVSHLYGIELHEVVARICKINLLLHHDGHTNIESNRSCLDSEFSNPRLNPPFQKFSKIVGNPPIGDEIEEGDTDLLGKNELANFTLAEGRTKIESEQAIIERCASLLEPGGSFGLVVPDGLLNNQGEQSNCPQTRMFLAKTGHIEAIVSLPDHAFRKAGAQNKTSVVIFKKFTNQEKRLFDRTYSKSLKAAGTNDDRGLLIKEAIVNAGLNYAVFLAEANSIGYTPSGNRCEANDLYRVKTTGQLTTDQNGTILGEYHKFLLTPDLYTGKTFPDCMAMPFDVLWTEHPSHRLDPKYHLFEREATRELPAGWIKRKVKDIMNRRSEPEVFKDQITGEIINPDKNYTVLTIGQTGEIRPRVAGKGNNPPEWLGSYFAESGDWFAAHTNDVVFSGIDLWKGCISVVTAAFDGGLVSREFPVYEITDKRLTSEFLQVLLRSRYYQRAFRAITTGHSNRRRTQVSDFEQVEVAFPPDKTEQQKLLSEIVQARTRQQTASTDLKQAMLDFSDRLDGRGREELPEVNETE